MIAFTDYIIVWQDQLMTNPKGIMIGKLILDMR